MHVLRAVDLHRSEFVYAEALPPASDACLAEEGRPPARHAYGQGDKQNHRTEQEQQERTEQHIEHALASVVGRPHDLRGLV
jgi:hypothetical protein